jgi:site-specific DNA-methyltransferase (adenine-specific)
MYITTPATPEAQQWDGWGTALKPAHEDWWLFRKPIASSTVASNVVQFGTGAINIDRCRLSAEPELAKNWQRNQSKAADEGRNALGNRWSTIDLREYTPQGRWPPNALFTHSEECTDDHCSDDCPLAELARQSGVSQSKKSMRGSVKVFDDEKRGTVGWEGKSTERGHTDTGTATRFYPNFRYQAKASPSERKQGTVQNNHPTVKSVALMQWLCNLITPPNGKILDPFMGSGSTGVAALS